MGASITWLVGLFVVVTAGALAVSDAEAATEAGATVSFPAVAVGAGIAVGRQHLDVRS